MTHPAIMATDPIALQTINSSESLQPMEATNSPSPTTATMMPAMNISLLSISRGCRGSVASVSPLGLAGRLVRRVSATTVSRWRRP